MKGRNRIITFTTIIIGLLMIITLCKTSTKIMQTAINKQHNDNGSINYNVYGNNTDSYTLIEKGNATFKWNSYFIDTDNPNSKKNGIYKIIEKNTESVTYRVYLNMSQGDVEIDKLKIKFDTKQKMIVETMSDFAMCTSINDGIYEFEINVDKIVPGQEIYADFKFVEQVLSSVGVTNNECWEVNGTVTIEATCKDKSTYTNSMDYRVDWDATNETINTFTVINLAEDGKVLYDKNNDEYIVPLFITSIQPFNSELSIRNKWLYKISNLNINGVSPSGVQAYSVGDHQLANSQYSNGVITYETEYKGDVYQYADSSYVLIKYSKSSIDAALGNDTKTESFNTIGNFKPVCQTQVKAYINNNNNCKISGNNKIYNFTEEKGVMYSEIKEYRPEFVIRNYTGKIISYDINIDSQNKMNTLYNFSKNVNVPSGFQELNTITINAPLTTDMEIKRTEKNYEEGKYNETFYDGKNHSDMTDVISFTDVYIEDSLFQIIGNDGEFIIKGWNEKNHGTKPDKTITICHDDINETMKSKNKSLEKMNHLEEYDMEDYKIIKEQGGYTIFFKEYSFKDVSYVIPKAIRPGVLKFKSCIQINHNELLGMGYDKKFVNAQNTIYASRVLEYKVGSNNGDYYDSCSAPYFIGKNYVTTSINPNTVKSMEYTTLPIQCTLKVKNYNEVANYGITSMYYNPTVILEFPNGIEEIGNIYFSDKDGEIEDLKVESIDNANKRISIHVTGKITKSTHFYAYVTVKADTAKILELKKGGINNEQIKVYVVNTIDGKEPIDIYMDDDQKIQDEIDNIVSPILKREKDTFDIDKDGKTDDYAYYTEQTIEYTDSAKIETFVGFKYNDNEVSSDVMNLPKGTKKVTVINEFSNFTDYDIDIFRYIGRVPYQGNKFIVKDDELGSNFTTTMTNNGISIPGNFSKLGTVSVYYSEEDVTIENVKSVDEFDSTDWKWKNKSEVEDWSKVKSFMIKLDGKVEQRSGPYRFTYEVNLPDTQEYGQATYTANAYLAYYNNSFNDPTGSDKAGIKIETDEKVNIALNKVDSKTNENVSGAEYKLSRVGGFKIYDQDKKEYVDDITYKIPATIKGLYKTTKYKLEETKVPDNYNKKSIVFEIGENNHIYVSEVNNVPVNDPEGTHIRLTGESSSDGSIGASLLEDPIEVDYTVNYYFEKDNYTNKADKYPTTADVSKTFKATIGTVITKDTDTVITDSTKVPDVNKVNYNWNENDTTKTMTVGADKNKNVFNVYFDKNWIKYHVEYYYENDAGQYPSVTDKRSKEDYTANIGTNISIEEKDKIPENQNIYELDTTTEWTKEWSKYNVQKDEVLKVYFKKRKYNYIVKYWYQNANDSGYTLDKVDKTRTGIIETAVYATNDDKTPKDTNTFTYNKDKSNESTTVTSDDSDIINIYFDRMQTSYNVEYLYQQLDNNYYTLNDRKAKTYQTKVGQDVRVTEDDKDVKIFTDIYELSKAEEHTKEWEGVANKDGSTTLRVYFKRKEAGYRVEWYYQNLDGKSYSQKNRGPDTSRKAQVGATVTADENKGDLKDNDPSYILSTKDDLVSQRTTEVKADGSSVIKIYFDLLPVKYYVDYYYENPDTGKYEQKLTDRPSREAQGLVGQTVEINEQDKNPGNKFVNYSLADYNTNERKDKLEQGKETRLKVYFECKKAQYHVKYLYQLDNDETKYSELATRGSVTREDKISKTVFVNEEDKNPLFDKYEYANIKTNEQQGVVTQDGKLTLNVYFNIKKVKYKVRYFYLGNNGQYPTECNAEEISTNSVKVGTVIKRANINTDPTHITNRPLGNYTLDTEVTRTPQITDSSITITSNENDNIFNVYFEKTYTVTYTKGNHGTFDSDVHNSQPYGINTPNCRKDTKTEHEPGYEFTGWSPAVAPTVTGDITYVAQWKAIDVQYKVEFYYQDDRGVYSSNPYATVTRMAQAGTTASLTTPRNVNDFTVTVTDKLADDKSTRTEDISRPKTDMNYKYDVDESRKIESATINGDGSTVLKVYFKYVKVKYDVDVDLIDTANKILTSNQFTITRQKQDNSTVLLDNRSVGSGIEVHENNLPIATYTYKITEDEAPNNRFVNVLKDRYILVTTNISDDGKVSLGDWGIYENDSMIDKTNPVYSYASVELIQSQYTIDKIKVIVKNPVTFTVEVTKVDSDSNGISNTGIQINSGIINEQNASHKNEIKTESKEELVISDNGNVSGSTNENGIIRYEETWVDANEYTYEIMETSTAGNQYVNILDGYKIQVKVKVGADGNLVPAETYDKNRQFIIVSEAGDPVDSGSKLYDYVNVSIQNNSISTIIDGTGKVNVNIKNPVKFNFKVSKLDTNGNPINGANFKVERAGVTNPRFNGVINGQAVIDEGPIDAGTYTYKIEELNAATTKYTNILNNRYIQLKLQVNSNGKVDIVTQDGDLFKVYNKGDNSEETDYDKVLRFIKIIPSVNNGVYDIDVRITNPVEFDVDVETRDLSKNFLGDTGIVIMRDNQNLWNSNASQNVEVEEHSVKAGTYDYLITQNTVKNNKYINPLEGKHLKINVTVSADGHLTVNKKELYNGNIGYSGSDLSDINLLSDYIKIAVDKSGNKEILKVSIVDPVRYAVEIKKVDTDDNGIKGTDITINSRNGNINQKTNDSGIIAYEEAWFNLGDHVYNITENETAGKQYVNILDGYRLSIKTNIDAAGNLSIVTQNNKDFIIESASNGTVSNDLCKYIKVGIDKDFFNVIPDKLWVRITNPVRFDLDIDKRDSTGNSLENAQFEIKRSDVSDAKYTGPAIADHEIKENPIKAGRYEYTIAETAAPTAKYQNILDNKYIKLILDVNANGHIDIVEQDGKVFKVLTNNGDVVNDEKVLKFIEIYPEVNDGVTTIKVKITNPVKYSLNITTATTAYDESKNIDEYFLDKTDVIVMKDTNTIYSAQPTKDVEVHETPVVAGEYAYYFTQTTTKSDKFVNPLENKFVKVTVKANPDGTLEILRTEMFKGTIGDEHNNRIVNDESEKYFEFKVTNPASNNEESRIDILIINPVRYTVEVKKVDTDNKPVENTKITVNSAVVDAQDAAYEEKVKETAESKDGIEITEDGVVDGTTNSDGVVKFEETWVESNESKNIEEEFYTYEITEADAAGNQYVNILEGYKVVIRVKVDPNGDIKLVGENGKEFGKNVEHKFEIVAVEGKEQPYPIETAYEYVSVNIESNSVNAIIKGTDELKVDITNPVRFNFDINKMSTDNTPLSGTKFTVMRDGKEKAVFEGDPTEKTTEDTTEDPINAGIYTYKIYENNTNKEYGDRYVNVLDDGKYIKLRVKVNADGVIDIVNANNQTDNNDYFEVIDKAGKVVTDDDVLRYIKVSSTDLDGDGVYTVNVEVKNPVQYEIDITTLDTLEKFLPNVNVSLYKVVGDKKDDLYTDNAIEEVEKIEIPADAGTYTYYVKENKAPTDRYINVLENRYIEITLTVAPNGMLTETHNLYEGEIGKGTLVTSGEVFDRFSVEADNNGNRVSVLNIEIINPVRFVVEVDKYDTAEKPLTETEFEIESPIIKEQAYEHKNEKINGIEDDGITTEGVVTGKTDNAVEKSKDGNMQRARISYEETWVDANEGNEFYTFYIRETKTSGAQYVNMLEGLRVAVNIKVGADGTLTLVDKNGTPYDAKAEYKFRIETEDGVEINPEDTKETEYSISVLDIYKYVNITVNNNKILATMNSSVINPVRFNVEVYETIYGEEKVPLNNIPVEIRRKSKGSKVTFDTDTFVTGGYDENGATEGFATMEESAVWADDYEYQIFQLDSYKNEDEGIDVTVEDEFVNLLDGYYIGFDLYVPGNGDIKLIDDRGDHRTIGYSLYKEQPNGKYEKIDFKDTMIDDFVNVEIEKDENNVCTLKIYIITAEKYNFKLEKTDKDVLYSVNTYPERSDINGTPYTEISPNMNDVEFNITVKDANGDIVLKDAKSAKDAKETWALIDTKSQLTKDGTSMYNASVKGILDFMNILIEKCGTYTIEIEEVTPQVEGMIYKDKEEAIVITFDIAIEDGKYVLTNMETKQGARYTELANTILTGDQTQTINVNVLNERIKGKFDLDLNKVNKFTGKPLDGAVYKVTVEQEGKEEKILYLSNDDVLSHEQLIAYEEEESTSVNGTTSIHDIRIELPETFTIKVEELVAPVIEKNGKKIRFTKLDDVIELEVTTGIKDKNDEDDINDDDAHYVINEIKLKDGNHNLISEEHSSREDDNQNIQVRIENEYFDLALRQYVVDVNGTKFTRKLDVNTDGLQSDEDVDATYTLNKEPQRAYAGQDVIYAIEVFNEGIIEGYAEEIMQYLPDGLEFVDDDFNKQYGWKVNDDNTGVVTRGLSQAANAEENLIPAYNKDAEKAEDRMSSKVIYLKLRVKDDVKLKTILTTIAEITEYKAKDRKESLDRDSYDLVTLPEKDELVEYADNQEDDDDFEKLIIEEFDLATVKYIKSINGVEDENRVPDEQLDPARDSEYKQGIFNGFKYKNENEIPKVDQNDVIVYGIQVRNEGSVGAYATEVMDTIPSGLKFNKNSKINSENGWYMLDADKNPTDDADKAKYVVTNKLAEANGKIDEKTGKNSNCINHLSVKDSKLIIDYRALEVEFVVVEPNSKDRYATNIANVSKFIDDLGINVKDRDPEERIPENKETIYINIFDLELTQVINSVEVTNEKTKETTVMNGDEIRKFAKVDIAKSKLKNTNIKVEYKITIKNAGESAGYAMEIKDYIPEGFTFDSNDNQGWFANEGIATTDALSNELLNPGDVREVTLVLRWNGAAKIGEKDNISEISRHADKIRLAVVDWDSTPDNKVMEEDDIDSTSLIISVKTGSSNIAVIGSALIFMIITSLGITAYNKKRADNN